jgi:hypothetical protein
LVGRNRHETTPRVNRHHEFASKIKGTAAPADKLSCHEGSTAMTDTQKIKEHMEVCGSDGAHVGTVDHLDGSSRIKLTKDDPKAGGKHHFIPVDWIDKVDDKVRLTKSARDAMAQWQAAA